MIFKFILTDTLHVIQFDDNNGQDYATTILESISINTDVFRVYAYDIDEGDNAVVSFN